MRRERPCSSCVRDLLRRLDGIARQTQCARQHARAAAGHEPDRQVVAVDAVQHLVEAAVAGEDDERVGVVDLAREIHRVTRALGPQRAQVRGPHQRPLDRRDPFLRDAARLRVDDQDGALHGVA